MLCKINHWPFGFVGRLSILQVNDVYEVDGIKYKVVEVKEVDVGNVKKVVVLSQKVEE